MKKSLLTIFVYAIMREKNRQNEKYDLLEIVVIYLGREKHLAEGNRLHQMLSTLLSETMTLDKRFSNKNQIYEAVIANEVYKNVTKEQVEELMKNN